MKIALLFSGQPRYLSNPFPLLSHQREVINKYDTDVYVHTWYDENVKEYDFRLDQDITNAVPICPHPINKTLLINYY